MSIRFPKQKAYFPFFISMSMFILKMFEQHYKTLALPTSTQTYMENQIMHSLSLLYTIHSNIDSRELFLIVSQMDQLMHPPSENQDWHALYSHYKQLETACVQIKFTNPSTQKRCLFLVKQLLEHAESHRAPFPQVQKSDTGHSSWSINHPFHAHTCKCTEKQE